LTKPELNAVLEDVRRHLLWQEANGGEVLLGARPAKALAGTGLRERAAAAAKAASSRAPAATGARAATASAPPRMADAPQATPSRSAPLSPDAPRAAAPARGRPASAKGTARSIFDLPPVLPVADSERQTLDEIRRELGDCRRCKLCEGRKQIVFGVGNPNAELVFVGEGPGAEEDAQGIPFVGKAGQLLTKMIEAMGFSRDDVYICNVVKCRPPENRNPELDEIEACEPFLRKQLGAIRPKAIVALGKFAAQTLLRDETPITRMRGKWREYCGVPLMPTFHPAYLLRNPAEKKSAWADLQQVMKVFGKERP
jgi:DNA polymerase